MRIAERRAFAVLLALVFLAGCYADLDWRKLASDDGRFQVLMPARSQSTTRVLGAGATMTLWTATARDALFGAGFTDYADDASAHLAEARDALSRNVAGTVVDDLADPAIAKRALARDAAPGARRITISGNTGATAKQALRPVIVHARLIPAGKRLYQLVVMTRPDALTPSELDMFFSSFELLREQ